MNGASHVMVVDDEASIRTLLADMLTSEGYVVSTAENGRAALALMDGHMPDVIVLDLMMPVMDGFSFRAHQLGRPELASIPVIIMSAAYDLALAMVSMQPRACLNKPFDLDLLLSAVASAVSLRYA